MRWVKLGREPEAMGSAALTHPTAGIFGSSAHPTVATAIIKIDRKEVCAA
jgi:hypothetical protein